MVEVRIFLVVVAKDNRPRKPSLVHERRPLHHDRLGVPRGLLPVQLVAAEDDQVRLDFVEGVLEPAETVDIRAGLLTGLFLIRVDVAALAGPDREVQVGNLEDLEIAFRAEAQRRPGRQLYRGREG